MKRKHLGVCVFDDVTSIGPGWASISGERATRISHFSELPQDVAWITNLNYKVYSRLNMNKLPHVYDEQYFRSSIKNICQESGVIEDGEASAVFCAKVLQNTYDETCKLISDEGVNLHPYRFYVGISGKIIPKTVRRPPSHASGFSIQEVMKESTQQNQAMFGVRAPSGSRAQPLTVPRASYFAWIMSQKLPACDGWREVKESDVSCKIGTLHGKKLKGTDAAIENIVKMAEDKALFLSVSIKSTDPFYRDFATFGSGANYSRSYATVPEILNLARHSSLEIGGGYSCRYLTDDERIDLDKSNMFRYSKGIALENIFAGLANPPRVSGRDNSNGLSAYLRSYDRVLCQRHAEIVARHGFTIGSFGTGKIIVYCQDHEYETLREACLEAKLMPPVSLSREGS